MQEFNPGEFVKREIDNTRKLVGRDRALVAISGGVDSTTSAVLTHKAIGDNLFCVMLDTAFMRFGEPKHVVNILSKSSLKLQLTVLDVKERFMKAPKGLKDAEEKRKMFRDTFYKILGETAKDEQCKVLVQGTIKADVDETTGGVKTQHNVLKQIGIDPINEYGYRVIEPLASLYKGQVRKIARFLGIPSEISDRQPFPGPGLSVRVVGEISKSKLESEKKATQILEKNFSKYKPSQYFTAILDNKVGEYSKSRALQDLAARFLNIPSRHVTIKKFMSKATGIKSGKRLYGFIMAVEAKTLDEKFHHPTIDQLKSLQTVFTSTDPNITRVLFIIDKKPREMEYVIILRAIETINFLTAKISNIPWGTLTETADEIIKTCSNVSSVYYDITPKPPATIEME